MTTNLPDLTTYSDDDMDAIRAAVDAETARRTRLATIPDQVSQLAVQYVDAGGTKAELTAVLS